MHAFPLEVGRNKRKLLVLNVTVQTDFSLIRVFRRKSCKNSPISFDMSVCPSVGMETVENS
jgi:hypothetical protein